MLLTKECEYAIQAVFYLGKQDQPIFVYIQRNSTRKQHTIFLFGPSCSLIVLVERLEMPSEISVAILISVTLNPTISFVSGFLLECFIPVFLFRLKEGIK